MSTKHLHFTLSWALVSSITKTARNSDCCYAGSDLIDLLEFACHAWSNAEPIDSPAG
jgi:hypothetical protein